MMDREKFIEVATENPEISWEDIVFNFECSECGRCKTQNQKAKIVKHCVNALKLACSLWGKNNG